MQNPIEKIEKEVLLKRQRDEERFGKEHYKEQKRKYKKLVQMNDAANEPSWWRLDNAANIYPSNTSAKWPAVFRVSAYLKEDVKKGVLQEALDAIMPRFPFLNVTIRSGLFWFYFERLNFTPIVKEETRYPCQPFNLKHGKHLFRVLYYKNKISFEGFHSLLDGGGAVQFVTTLLTRYFSLQGVKIAGKKEFINHLDLPQPEEAEDAFARYADLKETGPREKREAYQVKGTPHERGKIYAFNAHINLAQLKARAKEFDATITEFLLAQMLIVFEEQRRLYHDKRPVKIMVPVDLRRHFPSITMRNFSSFVYVTMPKNAELDLKTIIISVKEDLKKVNKEYLMRQMNANVKIEKNKIVRMVPLFIKHLAFKLSYWRLGERLSTTQFSNLGLVRMPEEFDNLVENFEFMIGASKYNSCAITCGTYKNDLSFTITSKIRECDVYASLFKRLAAQGIETYLNSNKII